MIFYSTITGLSYPQRCEEKLAAIHQGHQAVERSLMRMRASVWWRGVTRDVKYAENCRECAKERRPKREPMIPTPLPQFPWQQVGADVFELRGEHYLLVVDYFSRFPEVIKLTSTTSTSITAMLKTLFSHHGIPEIACSDNGPQFASSKFAVLQVVQIRTHHQ